MHREERKSDHGRQNIAERSGMNIFFEGNCRRGGTLQRAANKCWEELTARCQKPRRRLSAVASEKEELDPHSFHDDRLLPKHDRDRRRAKVDSIPDNSDEQGWKRDIDGRCRGATLRRGENQGKCGTEKRGI